MHPSRMGNMCLAALNLFDIINFTGSGASGNYNVTSAGAPIAP